MTSDGFAARTYLNNRHHDPTTGSVTGDDPRVAQTGQPYSARLSVRKHVPNR